MIPSSTLEISPDFRRDHPEAAALAEALALDIWEFDGAFWTACCYRLTGNVSVDGGWALSEDDIKAAPMRRLQSVAWARAERAGQSPRKRAEKLLADLRSTVCRPDFTTKVRRACLDSAEIGQIRRLWAACVTLRDASCTLTIGVEDKPSRDAALAALAEAVADLSDQAPPAAGPGEQSLTAAPCWEI